jgi:hypothetical protein
MLRLRRRVDLLSALARPAGRVVGREAVIARLAHKSPRFRRKSKPDPKDPKPVKSVRNVDHVFTGKVDR